MPNYLYKCRKCEDVIEITLPISSDPKEKFSPPGHKNWCLGRYERIMRPPGAIKGLKTFAGDWFKKTYGRDISEPYEDKAHQDREKRQLEKELRKRLPNVDGD